MLRLPDAIRRIFGLALGGILARSDFDRRRRNAGYAASRLLLSNMSQLVCEQPPAFRSFGCVSSAIEYDLAPHRICQRIHGSRRLRGASVRVNAHSAEVVSEPGLHKGAAD
jgi:hypothetical protein